MIFLLLRLQILCPFTKIRSQVIHKITWHREAGKLEVSKQGNVARPKRPLFRKGKSFFGLQNFSKIFLDFPQAPAIFLNILGAVFWSI